MPDCAFCLKPSTMSREHIFGSWISDLFPKKPWKSTYTDSQYRSKQRTSSGAIDSTARVVCGPCNNTWMSNIESQIAKPALSPLIRGDKGVLLTMDIAKALAIFAFKNAVVLDHTQRNREPWFSPRLRQSFMKHRAVPTTVSMWLAVYTPKRRRVDIEIGYYSAPPKTSYPIQLYVFTCAIGNLAFQSVAIKQIGTRGYYPAPGFENLAVPFWPRLHKGYVWPNSQALTSLEDFGAFHRRWDGLNSA